MGKNFVIKSSSEIRTIFRTGRRYIGENISVIYIFSGECGTTRVAFTVSNKIKRAVDRNRLKRLMREAFRHYHGSIESIAAGSRTGMSLVMNCSFGRPATMLALKDIEKDFDQFLRSIAGQTSA